MKKIINDGFLPPPTFKEVPEQYLAGTLRSIPYQEVVKPPLYWNIPKYIPTGEIQKSMRADWMACVIYSAIRCISFQINKMVDDNLLDLGKLEPWLDSNGKFNGCERALSILSGTSPNGNTQMRVGDTIDDFGIAPEWVYPNPSPDSNVTWPEYHAISEAKLNEVKQWGKKWQEYFYTRFERLPDSRAATLEYHLRQVPIWWATATCPGWSSADIISACSWPPSHATTGYGEKPREYRNDLDHYEPFEKKLAWNYPIYYPYKLMVYPLPSILKKEENGEDMPKFYQKDNGNPELYQLGADGLYHHIIDEPVFKGLYGSFDQVEIFQTDDITPDKIGFTIYDKRSFLSILINLLKGK